MRATPMITGKLFSIIGLLGIFEARSSCSLHPQSPYALQILISQRLEKEANPLNAFRLSRMEDRRTLEGRLSQNLVSNKCVINVDYICGMGMWHWPKKL